VAGFREGHQRRKREARIEERREEVKMREGEGMEVRGGARKR